MTKRKQKRSRRQGVLCECGRKYWYRPSPARTETDCPNCGNRLSLPDNSSALSARDQVALENANRVVTGFHIATLLIGTAVVGVSFPLQKTMTGSAFLLFYGIGFVASWVATRFMLSHNATLFMTMIPSLTFSAVGLVRILDGMQRGMHRWEFLVLAIAFGTVLHLEQIIGTRKIGFELGSLFVVPVWASSLVHGFETTCLWGFFAGLIYVAGKTIGKAVLNAPGAGSSSTSSSSGWTHSSTFVASSSFSSGGGGGCGGGGCGGGGCGGCGG